MYLTVKTKLHDVTRRKRYILERIFQEYTRAHNHILQQAKGFLDEIEFYFAAKDKEGQPKLHPQTGEPIWRLSSDMVIASQLRKRISLTDFKLHSGLKSSLWLKAADALLSYTTLKADKRFAERTKYPAEIRTERLDELYRESLEGLSQPLKEDGEIKSALEVKRHQDNLLRSLRPKYLPPRFSGPSSMRFFEHQKTKQMYVLLSLLAKDEQKAQSLFKKDSQLRPLAKDAKAIRTKSGLLFPLEFGQGQEIRYFNPPQRDFQPKVAELLWSTKEDEFYLNITLAVPEPEKIEVETFMGIHFDREDLATVIILNQEGEIVAQEKFTGLQHIALHQGRISKLRWLQKRGRWTGDKTHFEMLDNLTYQVANKIIELAQRFKSYIALENIKRRPPTSKWAKELNVILSLWNFSKLRDIFRYKAPLAGLPRPYLMNSFLARYTCGVCGEAPPPFQGKDKEVEEPPRDVDILGEFHLCRKCGQQKNVDENSALVLAKKARENWLRKDKEGRK